MSHAKRSSSRFNLNNFCIDPPVVSQHTFTIGIPTIPFTIRPNPNRKDKLFVYVEYHDNQWWLISAEVARQVNLPKMYKAELHFVLRNDGSYGILPVTLPKPGFTHSWYSAWQDIIPVAQRKWVKVTKDSAICEHTYDVVRGSIPIEWPDISDEEWLESTFEDRVIDSLNHPRIKTHLARRTEETIEEDF